MRDKKSGCSSEYQRKGYGKEMTDFLSRHYADKFNLMTVGTGDSMRTISFYRKCGFHYSHTVSDFFTFNYDHPIEEDGKILKDMPLFSQISDSATSDMQECPYGRADFVLTQPLKESVKASHHFPDGI